MPIELSAVIEWLETYAGELPALTDMADADMALMYLRHLKRHLEEQA